MVLIAGLLGNLPTPRDLGSDVGDVVRATLHGAFSALNVLLGLLFSRPGMVTAGAAATAATYRWWKYGFLGLFTRIVPPRALDQPTRARIFDYLQSHPGARAQDVVNGLHLATGQTIHHLRMLARTGLLVRTNGPLARRYFVAGSGSPRDLALHIVARHATLSNLHRAVIQAPGANVSQLAAALALSVARVSRMARQLSDAGLIERVVDGRSVTCFPKP